MVNPLARVVMNNMARYKEDSTSYEERKSGSNLSPREEELLMDLIYGKKEVENHGGKGNVVTLDQAVDMIKKGL